jgi:diguanylate cyclase (GGDEF)-like protein
MNTRLQTVRNFFAVPEDPYAGADMANAQRLGSVLWGLLTVLLAVLWISSPPTEAIGAAGWIPAISFVLIGAALVAAQRRGKLLTTWQSTLAAAYFAVLAIACLQWLAGGVGSPYERLCLLPVLYVGMIHPPRKIAAFMGFVALALTAPFIYDGWNADAAGATFATFVIWSCLAALGSVLMAGVRAQRVALAAEEARAREEARVDKLTGVHNRRAFDESLETEVERTRRQGGHLTVAMVDVHSFKAINDNFGHAEGDRCLREVAQAIAGAVRRPEMCFRWGGDEFALILAGTSANDAAPLGARLKGEVYTRCSRPDGEPMEIAFAVAELVEDMPAKELGEMAGLALTSAKAADKDPLGEDIEDRY